MALVSSKQKIRAQRPQASVSKPCKWEERSKVYVDMRLGQNRGQSLDQCEELGFSFRWALP